MDGTTLQKCVLQSLPCFYLPLQVVEDGQVHDISGYSNHGTVEGSYEQEEGCAGTAIKFDGKGYIDCGKSIRSLSGNTNPVIQEVSLTALLKLPSQLHTPLREHHPSCVRPEAHSIFMEHARWQGLEYEKGNLIFWHFFTGRECVSVTVPVASLLGQWIHVGWILKRTKLIAYVNGVAHRSPEFAQRLPGSSDGNLLVGAGYTTSHSDCQAVPSWHSSIQHFAVFPRALKRKEIQAQLSAATIKDHSIFA